MNENHDPATGSSFHVHEPIAFDLTEGQPLPADAGKSEPVMTVLPPVLFDFDEAVEVPFLRLTLHPHPNVDPAILTSEVLRLLDALNRYERALGGKGVAWSGAKRQELESGVIRLWLTPNELEGAQERLAQLAALVNGGKLLTLHQAFPPLELRSLARWEALACCPSD